MDNIEAQFMMSVATEMNATQKRVTDGHNSDKSGLNSKNIDALKEKLGSEVVVSNDSYLQPLQITNDMIRDIKEFDGEILPESNNLINTPNPIQSVINNPIPQNIDKNQLEFDFEQVRADDVFKELNIVKQLILKQNIEIKNIMNSISEIKSFLDTVTIE